MAAPVVSSNSPSAGFISWTATRIVFAGNSYPIPAGSTNKRFTYWRLTGSTPGVYTQATDTLAGGTSNVISTDVLPDSTAFDGLTDTMLFLNKSGVAVLAPSATTVDGSLIVSGSILTDAIGANQIVSTHIAANEVKTVNLAADAVLAAKIKAGEINTNHLSSGVVTASKLSIGSFTDNLAPNPYFEDWPVANAMPDLWSLSTATGYTGATVTRETASGSVVAGTLSLGLAAATGQQAAIFSSAVPCVAGRDIYLGVYYAGTGAAVPGGILAGLYFYNAAGALIATQSTPDDITGGLALEQVQHVGIAPAGAVTMQPLIIVASTTKVLLDNVEMAYRTQGVMIQDNAITAGKINSGAVTTDKLDSKAVTADRLEANLSLVNTLTTRTKDAAGAPTGAGIDLTSEGFFTYNTLGERLVEIPSDPTKAATFRGDAVIDHLTVQTITTLLATQLAQNAVFTLLSAVSAPTNPPTVRIYYNNVQHAADSSWSIISSHTTDGTNFYNFDTDSPGFLLKKWSATGTLITFYNTNLGSGTQVPMGICYTGTKIMVLSYNKTTPTYYITQHDPTTLAPEWTWTVSGTTAQKPENLGRMTALGYDFATGDLILAQSRLTNADKVRFQRLKVSTTTGITWGTSLDTTFAYPYYISSVLYGNFDFGSPRYVFGNYGNTSYQVATTAGAQDLTLAWEFGSTNDRRGISWSGLGTTTGNFNAIDSTGNRLIYEAGAGNRWTTSTDSTWYASYSWTGASAVETPMSPVTKFTMQKRARVRIYPTTYPTNVTGANIFLKKGTTAPTITVASTTLQGAAADNGTSIGFTVTNATFATNDNKITNTFPSTGTPAGLIQSSKADTTPLIKLSGDGSGRVGPWSWDTAGAMLTQPAYTPSDTGWVNFTCGSGDGMFLGTTGITLARYRILNGHCTVQISRNVLVAEADTSNANYPNDQVTASGALPSAARPTLTGLTNMYGSGNIQDVPVTVAISSGGTVFTVGGGLRSYAVGEVFQCSITYPLG